MRWGKPNEKSNNYEQKDESEGAIAPLPTRKELYFQLLITTRSMQFYWKLMSLPVGSKPARLMGLKSIFTIINKSPSSL